MQLISLPVSPFAARVRMAIYAKRLAIEIVPPPAGWRHKAQFREISLTGRIPVLLHDRGALCESAVVVEFLEERYPNAPHLLPTDVYDRAQARLLMRHVDLYLMPAMVDLARPQTDEAAARRLLQELTAGLETLNDLLSEAQYAVADHLSLADCALVPALFAARVTGERVGIDLLEAVPTVARYESSVQRDEHAARVLDEMAQGLRSLV
jgi:glutathione S-transferase